jgi:acyl-CoA dehydrogenase
MTATADRGTIADAAREAAATAAANAELTDREARFPAEAVAQLGASGLLGAAAPVELGGLGCDLATVVEIASALARGCGSTAMIWAMHQLQLACVVRHGGAGGSHLAELIRDHRLIASVTSEVGVGGNIGASVAAVTVTGDRRSLTKQATTVSYGRQAGAFLVTARRDPEAAAGDQVAVLLDRASVHCEQTGRWNPMGMRGTDSPAMLLSAEFDPECVLPTPFSDIAAATMVPLSHLLWCGVWAGLATEAYERARRLARARRRSDPRIAAADEVLSGVEARIDDAVRQYEPFYTTGDSPPLRLGVRLNALKTAVSLDAVRVVELALESCGMAGYQEEGDHSVARLLRDLYSARLMVANDRLLAANAATLLTVRRD